jgi:teichuronic acid biosynthesis glycosyltransferase TuaG
MPLISVIIPAYNREQYLGSAIQSVLDQTMSDLEVLIINDASTDQTGSIAEDFAKKDNRVRVIHHTENKHRSGALNTGIEHAQGTYISILDSDDYYVPDKLERQVAFLESNIEVDGVYGDFEMLYENNPETRLIQAIASTENVRNRLIAKAQGEDITITPEGYIPSCSALIRKEVFDMLRFDTNLRNMEDLDMWMQILGKGFVLTRLPGSTYVYRRHGDQKSSNSVRATTARAAIEEKMKSGVYIGD